MEVDFDVDSAIDAFVKGRTLRQRQQALDDDRESEKLRRDLLKHQIQQSKLAEKVREFENKKGLLEILEGLNPAPGKELMGPPNPEGPDEPGIGAPLPGKHPPIDFSGLEEIGVPAMQVQPRSRDEVRQAGLADLLAKQRVEQNVNIDPRIERLLPPEMRGIGNIPKPLIEKLVPQAKAPEKEIEISPGVAPEIVGAGGGTYSESELDLLKSRFTEGEQSKRSKYSADTAAAARGMVKGADVEDPTIASFVDLLSSGQITFANVPYKYKGPVAVAIGVSGNGILNKATMDKMDHFVTARAGVEKLAKSLQAIEDSPDLMNKGVALAQFNAERDALSRIVGRSLGEKGVFTDQDKESFKRILSPNILATLTIPNMARKRLTELTDLMELVRQREFEAFQRRTGAKPGAPGAGKSGVTKSGAKWELIEE